MGMRRVLVILVVVVAVGCSSGDHKVTPPTTTAPAATGVVVGRMHIIGGPVRRNGKTPDQPLAGVVAVRPAPTGKFAVLSTVTVNRTGRFRITLRPGRYQLHGRPANTGLMQMASAPFQIKAGQTTTVDLVEYAT